MSDVLLALVNARAGRGEAFDAWYTDEHLPAILRVDGVLGGRRLQAAADLPDGPEHPFTFLSVYDVASGTLAQTADRLIASGPPMSEDADGPPMGWCFEELGPRVTAPDAGDGPFDQMVVFTNPVAGADADFNRWYDEVHVPDILDKIGGFASAHRFRRADAALNHNCPWGYLAMYDIPRGGIAHALARVHWSRTERELALAAGREPAVPLSPALDEVLQQWFFRETVPYMSAAAAPAA